MRSKSKRKERRKEKFILDLKVLNIAVFVSMLSIFSIGSIVLPKSNISEVEKRELASIPKFSAESFLSGEYFQGLESFYNDTFPFRDKFINVASSIDEMKGMREGEQEIKIYTVKK